MTDMTSAMKIRLAALVLAVAVMGGLIVFVTLYSQRQGAELGAKLKEVESQSQSISELFKDKLREQSDKMARYRTTADPTAWG